MMFSKPCAAFAAEFILLNCVVFAPTALHLCQTTLSIKIEQSIKDK